MVTYKDIFAQILTPNQHLAREIIEQNQVYVEARLISVGFIHSILGVVLNLVRDMAVVCAFSYKRLAKTSHLEITNQKKNEQIWMFRLGSNT